MNELGSMPYFAAGFGLFFLFALIFQPVMPFFILSVFLLIAGIFIYDAGTSTPKQQYTMKDVSRASSRMPADQMARIFSKAVSTSRSAQRPYVAPQDTENAASSDVKGGVQTTAPSTAVMVVVGLLGIWLMVS